MDILLTRLRQSGPGYYIGDTFLGALMYADDITILAPTPDAARKMHSICDCYAKSFLLLLMQKI